MDEVSQAARSGVSDVRGWTVSWLTSDGEVCSPVGITSYET
jgi:hypothetical protein